MDSLSLNEKIKRLYPFVNQLEFPLPEDGWDPEDESETIKTNTIKFKYEDFTFGQTLGKQVQEVTHLLTKQKMAVKFVPLFIALENDQNKISEKISEKFKEVTVLRELSKHKNIVDFYGFCLHKENLLIYMEVMDMSLRDLSFHAHKQYGYFLEEFLGVITVSVIKALFFCKAKRVMHRDLKPDNILVNIKKGQVKLADFGVSGILSETSHLTTAKGTILYWPPERFKPLENRSLEPEKYDERADIWSLGLTLCELVYNDVPYNKTTNEMSETEKAEYKRVKTEAEKYIDLQQQIKSETSEGLINRCFQQNNDRYPDPNTKDFIKLCLNPYEDRPRLEELENTNFYKKEATNFYKNVGVCSKLYELSKIKDSTQYQSNEDRTNMYATFDTYTKACYKFIPSICFILSVLSIILGCLNFNFPIVEESKFVFKLISNLLVLDGIFCIALILSYYVTFYLVVEHFVLRILCPVLTSFVFSFKLTSFIVYLIEGENIKHGILSDLTSRFLYTMFYALFINTFSTLWALILILKYFIKENVKKEYALNEELYMAYLQLFLRITIIFTPFCLLDTIYNIPLRRIGDILLCILLLLFLLRLRFCDVLHTPYIDLFININVCFLVVFIFSILFCVVSMFFLIVDHIKKFHTTGTQHGMRDLLDLILKDNNGGFLVIIVIMYMAMIICAIFFDTFSKEEVIVIVKFILRFLRRCTSTPTNATNLENDNTDERRNLLEEEDSLLANEENQEETRIQIEDPEQPQNSEQFMDPVR